MTGVTEQVVLEAKRAACLGCPASALGACEEGHPRAIDDGEFRAGGSAAESISART